MSDTGPKAKRDVIIRAENVKKHYWLGGERVEALRGVSLEIYRGEFIAIMGPSGSGKSTFFNQIGALDVPTEGKVYFEGESVFDLSESKQAWFRCNRIGYIFQTYNLIAVMSAIQNVMLPMVFQGTPKPEARRRAQEILDRVGLGERADHKPFELSGGQQQRVAIARALANMPSVVLADEPTGNLDTKTGQEIIKLLKNLQREVGLTIICATHDTKMINSSDRVCWLRDGQLDKVSAIEEFQPEA
jgi:putative ABC transport system ATP-binding protein